LHGFNRYFNRAVEITHFNRGFDRSLGLSTLAQVKIPQITPEGRSAKTFKGNFTVLFLFVTFIPDLLYSG